IEDLIDEAVIPLRRLITGLEDDVAALRALVEEARETPAPPAEPQEPPVTGPLVNESFNPAAPTLKTGEPLTADQRTYHTAFTRAFYRSDPVAELSITREFGRGDSYHLGRWGQTIQDPALQV